MIDPEHGRPQYIHKCYTVDNKVLTSDNKSSVTSAAQATQMGSLNQGCLPASQRLQQVG